MANSLRLICADFREALGSLPYQTCIVCDPPDNIGLRYTGANDRLSDEEYEQLLRDTLRTITKCGILWVSFNARHWATVGRLVDEIVTPMGAEHRLCIQHIGFGYYAQKDFGFCYRPLLRIKWPETIVYPDAVRIESERQRLGDKRANPNGKICTDVWHIPRVTGNSRQRRRYHPTQINESLYERCLKFSCKPGDSACDLYCGTGTMARAARGLELDITLIDKSEFYCNKLSEEWEVPVETIN